jgi:hypothetical protein
MIENENQSLLKNPIPVDNKKIMSARRNQNTKSPLDMVDFTNLTKPSEQPNFSKFMNQSSSAKLEPVNEQIRS